MRGKKNKVKLTIHIIYCRSEEDSVLVTFFFHTNLGDNDPSRRLKIEEYAGADKATIRVTGATPHSLSMR